MAAGPKTSTRRYNIFGLVARANGTHVNGDPTVTKFKKTKEQPFVLLHIVPAHSPLGLGTTGHQTHRLSTRGGGRGCSSSVGWNFKFSFWS